MSGGNSRSQLVYRIYGTSNKGDFEGVGSAWHRGQGGQGLIEEEGAFLDQGTRKGAHAIGCCAGDGLCILF